MAADSTTKFEGGGSFYTQTGLSISSNGQGDSQGERVTFYHERSGRPDEGMHEFGAWDGDHGGFTGFYVRTPGPYESASFVITDGWILITESTWFRVEGSFAFTAALYCSTADYPHDIPCAPSRVVPGGTSVKMEGSFSVGRPGPVCPARLDANEKPVC